MNILCALKMLIACQMLTLKEVLEILRAGDYLTVYIKVKDNHIDDISYLVFGCSASIATSSMTSVMTKGKGLDEALRITEEDIIEALNVLPESKVQCSNVGVSALRNAINNYLVVKRMEDSYENSNSGR